MKCYMCKDSPCGKGEPCVAIDSRPLYDEVDQKLMKVAAAVEADYYCQMCRVDEIMEFCRRMGYKKIGIANCTGFQKEAKVFAGLLSKEFEVYSAFCKIGGVRKADMGHEERPWLGCTSCNPAEQARSLEQAGTKFNVILGLCVGHDSVFMRHSKAPCTVLAVKDRLLGNNPAVALTCDYIIKGLGKRHQPRTE